MIRAAPIDRCRSVNRLGFHLFKLWFANCPSRDSAFRREKWPGDCGRNADVAKRDSAGVGLKPDKTRMRINAERLTTVAVNIVKPGSFRAVQTNDIVLTNYFDLQFVPCACD